MNRTIIGRIAVFAVILLMSSLSLPSRAADNRWEVGAAVEGVYTGNLLYNEGGEVSSYGGSAWFDARFLSSTPRSDFTLSYRPAYSWYGETSDANNLEHSLTATLRQEWSPRLTFRFSEDADYTPEQNGFIVRPEERFTVVQRATRTTSRTRIGWTLEASPRNNLSFGYSYRLSRHRDPEVVTEQPLFDRDTHRATLGWSFATGSTSRLGVVYDYTRQEFEREEFFRVFDSDGELERVDTSEPKGAECSMLVVTDCFTAISLVEEKSDAHNLGVEYTWLISEQSRGRLGAGAFRSRFRETTRDEDRQSESAWYLRANVNRQLSQRLTTYFGASRDISSFGGLGGRAIGETVFGRLAFKTSQQSSLRTTVNYTRRKDLGDGDRRVNTLGGEVRFSQRLGRWGGWSAGYSHVDQDIKRLDTEDRAVKYDIFRLGIFFERSR